MAPTVLKAYASSSSAATHVIPLTTSPSKNTLWIAAISSGAMTGPAGASIIFQDINACDVKIWQIDNPASSMTSVTITCSATVNLCAIIFEDQRDTTDTPYVQLNPQYWPLSSGDWPSTPLGWSGKSQAVALNFSDRPTPTSGDIATWDNGFVELADTGLAPGGSFNNTRMWAASAALPSFSGQLHATTSPIFVPSTTDSFGNMTKFGVLAYKTAATTPTANAGPDQSVASSAAVTLDGSASSGGPSSISTYNWTQISGPAVTLASATTAHPTFTAPVGPATLVFGLTVTNTGAQTSAQDTVSIAVSAPAVGPTPSVQTENANATGVANRSAWFDLVGQAAMPGFVRKSYYAPGTTAQFSIDYNSSYTCEVYRLGWYGSSSTGARKVASFAGTPANQPAAVAISNSNGAVDCSNWSTNVTWAIPADACPGWYNLVLKGSNGVDDGQILFCVTDTALPTRRKIAVLSADATWGAAYNYYGGKTSVTSGSNLYGNAGASFSDISNRSLCVSYDRPIVTAEGIQQTYFFNAEYPLLRFLERFGFDVGYVTCEQVDADPTVLNGRDLIIVAGHNEYISQNIKDKFDSLAATGQSIMNLSGNDFFWRTRYGTLNAFDTATRGRVMWCRKDTMNGPGSHVGGTPIVDGDWGGTWQDTRWAGKEPTMALFGDRFIANGVRDDNLTVPFAYKNLALYRNCSGIQALASGGQFQFGQGTLGMEWDKPETTLQNGLLSATTVDLTNNSSDVNGQFYNVSTTTTHSMMIVKHPASGGYIFNAANVQYSWVLDGFHVRGGDVSSNEGRQMTLNVMADLAPNALPASTLVTGAGLVQPVPVADIAAAYGLGAGTTPVTIFPPAATVQVSAPAPTVTAITPWVRETASTAGVAFASPSVTVKAVDPTKIPNPVWAGDTATLDDLIDEVYLQLQGYCAKGDQVTFLTQDLEPEALTFTPDDAKELSRGVIEIDAELMRVLKVDRISGTVSLLPQGRGWRGTVPVPHAAGATVTMSPLVPRVSIGWAINDTIRGLYPDLFAVGETTFVFNSGTTAAWPLPAEADRILAVDYQDDWGNWQRVRVWEAETRKGTGRTIRVSDVPLGHTVRVEYGFVPKALEKLTTAFTDSGLTAGHRDLIITGAQIRLLPALDTARLSVRSVSADELDQPVQLGAANSIGKALYETYSRRLLQEQQVLQRRYPAPVHFVR